MMSDLDYWQLRLHKFIDTKEIDVDNVIDEFNRLSGIGKVRFTAVVSDIVQPLLYKYNVDPRYFKQLLDKKILLASSHISVCIFGLSFLIRTVLRLHWVILTPLSLAISTL